MTKIWEVYALKYSERNDRTRADSFIFDDDHGHQHDMDYFIWLLRCGDKTILVDTGYDSAEARRRQRPILREPGAALAPLGITPESITDVIVTHLHYDHAGGLNQFPNATIHIQSAEMAFAVGSCMCHDVMRMPYSAEHICEVVRRTYSGRVVFYDGDAQIDDGVIVYQLGGHSKGLQSLGVRTKAGIMCLASDAAHYYENALQSKPFPIVIDTEKMLLGFKKILSIASEPGLLIPGHDPLVRHYFPVWNDCTFIHRLDHGPSKPFDL